MDSLLALRVSRVEPAVEDNLVQLVDMVKQIGRKSGNLTESQNRKMVGYMGNLDEMRGQIVIMIQRYENDSHVLKRLLDLVDRIDDVKNLAVTSEESKGKEGTLMSDQDIAAQYDTPFNPLMVSTLNILDVSGLFASKILGVEVEEEDEEDEHEEEEEEGDGDAFWDHQDDPAMVAEESEPIEVSAINLSMSNLHLPSLFQSCDNLPTVPLLSASATIHSYPSLSSSAPIPRVKTDTVRNNLSVSDANLPSLFDSHASHPTIPPPPPLPQKHDLKGKGKAKRQLGIDTRSDTKGKGKVTFQGLSSSASMSGSEPEEDMSDKELDMNRSDADGAQLPKVPTIGWRRTLPSYASSSSSSASASASSSSAPPPSLAALLKELNIDSGSDSESTSTGTSSETDSRSSDVEVTAARATALAKKNARKNARSKKANKTKKGPCSPPVLCKICYDEYDKWEMVHEFEKCNHTYCRECLGDYLATNINEGAVLDLACPFPDCQTEFLQVDIKSLSSPEIYTKYERFTLLAALRADPNARWCPNPFCNNGIKHNPDTMPWVNCNACKFEFCFHCMAERHDGAACGEEALTYLQKKHESELAATAQFDEWASLMKALVKPCPGCKAFIEKNDGCNHMTCTNPTCRIQFCWLCLSLYTGEHFVDDINFPDCYDKQYWTPPDILLQSANYARQAAVIPRSRRFANIAKKVGMYMGVGVAVVTLGVPAAVIGGPVYGCFKLHKRLKARRRSMVNERRMIDFVPPTPQRIAEARREAQRLYDLEHS